MQNSFKLQTKCHDFGTVCLCHPGNGVCQGVNIHLSPPAALYNDPCSNHRHQRVECVDVACGNGDGEAQKKSCPLLHWRTWSKSKFIKLSNHGNSTPDPPNDWVDFINRMWYQPQWIKIQTWCENASLPTYCFWICWHCQSGEVQPKIQQAYQHCS